MPVKISQFLTGGTMLAAVPMSQGDIVAGLRVVNGVINNYQFSFPGIGINDSDGNPLLRWSAPTGTNVNYLDFANAASGIGPSLLAVGTDTNVDLNLGGQGAGYVNFIGTGAIAIPSGTTSQQPTGKGGGLRYNNQTGFVEYWDTLDSTWTEIIAGAAPFNATYITQTDETAFIPQSIPLSGLPSGFLSSVTGTGVLTNRSLTSAANTRITIVNPTGAGGNPVFDLATTGVVAGAYLLTNLTVDAYGRITSASSGTGSGTAGNVGAAVTQNSHGFSVGQILYLNGTTYALAQANSTITAEVAGIVGKVIDSNNFILVTVGYITGLSGLTAGSVYWLSDSNAGVATLTIPTTQSNITKPVWIAATTTTAYIYQERGKIIPGPAGAGFVFNGATTSQTIVADNGYTIQGSGVITLTIPSSALVNDYYVIAGQSASGWIVQMSAGQVLNYGSNATSSGGTLTSTNRYDSVSIVCSGTNIFTVYAGIGNPTPA